MNLSAELRLPSPEEFNHLRQLAGWPVFESSIIQKAFANTFFSVCILDEGKGIIGMGRVIGDNAIYLHIQDVIVHPEYQRKGVGKMIMDELMKYTEATAEKNTMIGLMCSKGREAFYKGFGFIERPNEKFGAGMVIIK
jgi:GNAT superfamily N-acetyltransferase